MLKLFPFSAFHTQRANVFIWGNRFSWWTASPCNGNDISEQWECLVYLLLFIRSFTNCHNLKLRDLLILMLMSSEKGLENLCKGTSITNMSSLPYFKWMPNMVGDRLLLMHCGWMDTDFCYTYNMCLTSLILSQPWCSLIRGKAEVTARPLSTEGAAICSRDD